MKVINMNSRQALEQLYNVTRQINLNAESHEVLRHAVAVIEHDLGQLAEITGKKKGKSAEKKDQKKPSVPANKKEPAKPINKK